MIKAYSYLRVSSYIQIEGDGFDRQRDCISRYCKLAGVEVAREFVELGVSGTKDCVDREELTNLFAALTVNDVKLVLVEHADRLARSLMISELLFQEFKKLGVSVIAASSGTDLSVDDDNPDKIMIRQLFGVLAQWDKSKMVIKTRAARERIRRESGRCEGKKPYGDRVGEKPWLELMIDWRNREELTLQEVADRLNQANVAPRHSGKWHANTVRRILERV